jgi:transposase InsO family protein
VHSVSATQVHDRDSLSPLLLDTRLNTVFLLPENTHGLSFVIKVYLVDFHSYLSQGYAPRRDFASRQGIPHQNRYRTAISFLPPVCHETICNIINNYRKAGIIKPNGSWKRFLTAHWNSLFACDFFTVDCFGFIRLYVFFIIQLNSRKIVHWNITTNPSIKFLRLQFSEFENNFPDSYLIHDNSGELRNFPYHQYRFNHVATSPYSPNMNAFAERFVRSVRQECLNHFIVFSYNHLRNLMREYVYYYNNYRPHQGLHGIPNAPTTTEPPDMSAKIKKIPILFGLHHHYYRESA